MQKVVFLFLGSDTYSAPLVGHKKVGVSVSGGVTSRAHEPGIG